MALTTALNSRLEHVIAITKKEHNPWLEAFANHNRFSRMTCPESQYGQAHSIQCGLRYAESYQAEAILIMLADQPFITVHMINTLIETYTKKKDTSFIASRYNGIICPPILLTQQMFPDLYNLKGDHGARYLLREKTTEGSFLDFPYNKAFRDIDTITDYERVIREDLS